MELNTKRNNTYPAIKVGDKVCIYKKRKKIQQSRIPPLSDIAYDVADISHSNGIAVYKQVQ